MSGEGQLFTGPRRYSHRSIDVTGPKLIGYFSIDNDFDLSNDTSQLKYLVVTSGPTSLDLSLGTHTPDTKTEGKRIPFFRYLLCHRYLLTNIESSIFENVGFVTSRSTLIDIAEMPYSKKAVVLGARMINGAIYIYNNCKYTDKPIETAATKMFSKWGHKYRQYMLSESCSTRSNPNLPVKKSEEFAGVFEIQMNEHKIIYKSEIQGFDSHADLPTGLDVASIVAELNDRNIIALRTRSKFSGDTSFRNHKARALALQMIFGKVERVLTGIRDEKGFVDTITDYNLNDLQEMGSPHWKTDVTMSFCDAFFTYVKKCFASKLIDINNFGTDLQSLPPLQLHFKRISQQNLKVVNLSKHYDWVPRWYSDNV